ncbi:putative NUDIX family hydrolase [Trypanosoma theileri]|uniref:Putative NUDIX family hydrolase n=1 Tax=Trypanosoma theileri TaxID=67003 RepID=A0A1X0NPA0_9TRYP|nr:putative NUDIX family hydrolase [Trypanosoma theileri]ORC86524.1 putative NUDIX family hydrolase [Trypanosoma theileri]
MSLPAVDVNFLLKIAHRMEERRLHVYVPSLHRSATAILLRFGNEQHQNVARHLLACRDGTHSASALLQHLASAGSTEILSSLSMLFVKRADVASDRWSGSVSFPGGRRDVGDVDDLHTVFREVYQMLGIPLKSNDFILLGRLRDYSIQGRHISTTGAVQSRFVFLHIGDLSPTVHFARHEVDAVQWVPISRFAKEHAECGCVCHPLSCFLRPTDADSRLLLREIFPHAYLSFPSVQLHDRWRVWGLALRTTSELLSLEGRPPIDWPLVSSNNALLQHFVIDAVHGYYEMLYTFYRLKAWLRLRNTSLLKKYDILPPEADSIFWAVPESIEPRHIFFLFLDVFFAVFILYCVASVIFVISTAICVMFGWTNTNERREQIHAYYAANTSATAELEQWNRKQQQQQQEEEEEGEEEERKKELNDGVMAECELTSTHPELGIFSEKMESATPSLTYNEVKPTDTESISNTTITNEKENFRDDLDAGSGNSCNANDHISLAALPSSDDWNAFRQSVREWAGKGAFVETPYLFPTKLEDKENH